MHATCTKKINVRVLFDCNDSLRSLLTTIDLYLCGELELLLELDNERRVYPRVTRGLEISLVFFFRESKNTNRRKLYVINEGGGRNFDTDTRKGCHFYEKIIFIVGIHHNVFIR